MNADQILLEIRETNLSYLTLAQTLIRSNREEAMTSLGLSEAAADRLASLSPTQLMKVASSNTLVCRMTMSDDMVWGLLTNHCRNADGTPRLSGVFGGTGRHQEAA